MQIFVRTDRTLTLDLPVDATVETVLAAVEARQGTPAADLRLSFGGRPLASGASLAAAGVSDDSTLEALARLLGGGKKRKKKVYTKPKKIKHKHRLVKMSVLKYYKVDDSGKVERLRQACPTCGPAVFMAKHFDRIYCGKCHATFMVEAAAAGGKKGKK